MKKRSVLIVLVAIFLVFSFSTTAIFAKADVEVIKEFMRSDVVFNDFVKFKEAVDSQESRNMLNCMLEIYPDLVAEMERCITDNPDSNTASVIPPFNPILLSATIGVVVGVSGTLIAVALKKKKLQ